MASEIRANTLKNRVGLGTISFTNTGAVVSGIVTIANSTAAGVTLEDNAGVGNSLKITTPTGYVSIGSGNSTFVHLNTDRGIFYFQKRITVDEGIISSYDEDLKLQSPVNTNRITINKDTGLVSVVNDLDVDGHTNLDNVSIAGVVTATTFKGAIEATSASFSSNIDANGDLDVDGHTNLDNVSIAGINTIGSVNNTVYTPHTSNWATRSAITLFGNYGGGLAFNDNNNNGFVQYVSGSGVDFWLSNGAVGGSLATSLKATKGGAVQLYHAGTSRISTASYGAAINGDLLLSESIVHSGDTDTKLVFTDNQIDLQTGGSSRMYANNYAVYIKSGLPLAFLATSGATPNIKSGGTNNQDLLLTTGSGNPTRLQIASDGVITGRGELRLTQGTSVVSNGDEIGSLMFTYPSNDNKNAKIVALQNAGTSGADLAFYTRTHGDGTNTDGGEERLRITSAGQVKITGVDDQDNLVVNAGSSQLAVHQDDTDGEVSLRAQDASGNNYTKYMTFFTEGGSGPTERLRIESAGNINAYTNQIHLYNSVNTSNTYYVAQNTGAGNAGIKMKNQDGEWTIIANDKLRFYDDDAGLERLSILSSGIIKKPYQVAFFAHCNIGNHDLSAGDKFQFNVLTSSGKAAVDSTHHTFGGTAVFNTSNNTFTAPVAGLYSFTVTVYYRRSGDPLSILVPRVNNTQVTNGNNDVFFVGSNDITDGNTESGTLYLQLAANDAVTVHRRTGQTGSCRYYGPHSHFCGHLIG